MKLIKPSDNRFVHFLALRQFRAEIGDATTGKPRFAPRATSPHLLSEAIDNTGALNFETAAPECHPDVCLMDSSVVLPRKEITTFLVAKAKEDDSVVDRCVLSHRVLFNFVWPIKISSKVCLPGRLFLFMDGCHRAKQQFPCAHYSLRPRSLLSPRRSSDRG